MDTHVCNTACTDDTDCQSGFYCKTGGTCVAQIKNAGSACDPSNCEATGCKQCADGGTTGSACGSGNKCP
jgi:hypothetical protein